MTIIGFLRDSFRLYFGAFRFITTRLLPLLVLAALVELPDYGTSLGVWGANLASILIVALCSVLLIQHHFPDRPTPAGISVSVAWLFLGGLYVTAAVFVVGLFFTLTAMLADALSLTVAILLVIPALFIATVTLFHPVFIVRKGQTMLQAIGQSVELANGRVLKLLIGVAVVTTASSLLGYGLGWAWELVAIGPSWLGVLPDSLAHLLNLLLISAAVAGYRQFDGDNFVSPQELPCTSPFAPKRCCQ